VGEKIRIDRLLVERELAPSRERAQSLIMAGAVLVDDIPVTKSGQQVSLDAEVRIRGEDHPFVSRGGVKLAHALKEFDLDVKGFICLDVGASTGGFTDCLLQNGASKIYAVDVGYGQLAWKLKEDPRVVVVERQNIRHIDADQLPEPFDLIVIDVSFISLDLVLPVVVPFLKQDGGVVSLVKPQFEVGKELVGKGGIVKDPASHKLALEKVINAAQQQSLSHLDTVESPIEGTKGNKEFLVLFRKYEESRNYMDR
jgi:23S rRNA (cytidine1920-2'-O)/16S rRNA (cytidine1409-2'-O)-methyltransferase